MAAKDLLHADQIPASMIVGENIRLAGEAGLLTDTNVQNATTDGSLRTNISGAAPIHAELEPIKGRLNRAIVLGDDDGTLNDTDIQAATSITTLAALTHSQPGKIGPLAIG